MILSKPNHIKIYGHRGARGNLPENTLESFSFLFENEINAFETDILISKDLIPVITHDFRLDINMTKDAEGNWIKDENIKKGNKRRFIKTEEKLEYPRGLKQQMAYPIGKYSLQEKPLSGYVIKTTADDKGELVPSKYHERVWKQRSRIAIKGPKEIPTQGGFTATIKETPVKYVPRYSGKGKARTGQQLKEKLERGESYNDYIVRLLQS